jgi:hypothetical protein
VAGLSAIDETIALSESEPNPIIVTTSCLIIPALDTDVLDCLNTYFVSHLENL